MNLKKSKWLWYGIATLIFALLIYLADVGKFVAALTSVDPFYMFIALIFGVSYFLFFGVIWHLFLKKMKIDVNFLKSMKLVLAGNFMNSVTPLGPMGGEPFMAYVVSKNTDASYEKAISCIVSADMVNTIPFLTYSSAGIIYFILFRSINNFIVKLAYLTAAMLIGGALFSYFLWFEEEKLKQTIFRLLDGIEARLGGDKYIEKGKDKVSEIKEAFNMVGSDPRNLLKTAAVAHLSVIAQFISLYFIMLALGVHPLLPAIYFTVVISGLATISPTPGGSGTFEAAFSGLLMVFYTLHLDTALAIAVLFRFTTYWPGIAIGYAALLTFQREREEEAEK